MRCLNKSATEDQTLNLIAKEAEVRLAVKRAARAEARSIRMKEIEREQNEGGDEDENCLVDLHECGMRERDVTMIYKLNEKAGFKVASPAGLTERITVREIVKQGTVFGPKL